MSVLPINKDTYFTQNIYVTRIDISTKPFLNIANMSITGNVSIDNLNINKTLNTTSLKSNTNSLIQFNTPIYSNTTKTENSIGYSNNVTNATTYTISQLVSKVTIITVSGLPAGVYAFSYYYNIGLTVPLTSVTLYQVYNYIDNTTTSTNLLTKNASLIHSKSVNQIDTTYGVLTEASNTITFSLSCLASAINNTFTFNSFNLRYTRIA